MWKWKPFEKWVRPSSASAPKIMQPSAGANFSEQCPPVQKQKNDLSSILHVMDAMRGGVRVCFIASVRGKRTCLYVCYISQLRVCVYVNMCVCVCFYEESLLVCTLHSWTMVATFLIWTIIISLPPGSTPSLTLIKFCEIYFLCIWSNDGRLRAGR